MAISKINVGGTEHTLEATKLVNTRYIDGVSFTGEANVTRYATCGTAAGTAAKTASITSGTFSLITGARVTVKFTYANTVASPTLNVGGTGAKAIYWHGASLVSGQYWQAGAVLDFVYNGTQWELVGVAKDNNTTYSTFVKSGSDAKAGLVPKPSTTAGTTKYLREDGTWTVPPDTNTTYTFDGAVSTIKDSNLTASRALISNSSGKVAVSAVTSTELGYLDGVTSAIQPQLDSKADKTHALSKGTDTTASSTLNFGGTFTAVTDTTVSGHTITDKTTTYTMPSDRLFTTLVPTGTAISTQGTDLKSTTYLKVGRYYCSANATAETLKNCPTNKAFMMEVYSPLSTTIDNETTEKYVYRLRKITEYNTGVQYIQYVGSGATAGSFTYNDWYAVPRAKVTLDTTDTNDGSAATGSATKPVYVASDGTITACTYTLGKSVPSDAKFTDTTYTSLKNPYSLTIQGNGTTLTNGTYDGSAAKTVNITPSSIGAATSGHTHNYAGSSSAGGAATSASTIAVTNTTTSSATTYYPMYVTGTSGNQTARVNTDLYYYDTGTDSYFNVGSASNTGGLTLHNKNGKYINLIPSAATANRNLTLPDVDGTVVTTGNLPTASSSLGCVKTTSTVTSTSGLTACPIISGVPYYKNTTYSNMSAATADAAGKAGLVPAPAAGKQSSFLRGDGTWATPTNTKNTAGSTNSSSKLFLIGATSQAANPQTYSHDTAYVGTDGCLYSNSTKVSVEGHTHSYAASSHNQAASTITAGTLAGKVVANATATATVGNSQVRNIYAGTTDMTAGTSTLTTGTLYFVYE